MLLRYIDDILEQITQIHDKKILPKQHYFIEAIYYYNDAIANSLCKIKDEYKKHPSTTAATYPDINIRLLLNEIEQLRRDFSYEEKERERNEKAKNDSEVKSSFRQFVEKTQKTMYKIELYVENLGLDIKITYSLDNYCQQKYCKSHYLGIDFQLCLNPNQISTAGYRCNLRR